MHNKDDVGESMCMRRDCGIYREIAELKRRRYR